MCCVSVFMRQYSHVARAPAWVTSCAQLLVFFLEQGTLLTLLQLYIGDLVAREAAHLAITSMGVNQGSKCQLSMMGEGPSGTSGAHTFTCRT